MVEQSHRELHSKHIAHRLIDITLRDLTGLYELQQIAMIKITDHVHVHAGAERLACRGSSVIGDAVSLKFADRIPVADHKSPESPFFSQNLLQREWICRRRNSIQGVKSRHES